MTTPLFMIEKNRRWLILAVFFALLLTKSIGAFLSLFFGLIVYLYLRKKLKGPHLIFLFGLFLLIIFIFFWRFWGQREHTNPAFSAVMRLGYWRQTLEIIKEHPLTGTGLGNFNLSFSRYAHNSYLQILAETGIFGLFSFMWLIFCIFKVAIKKACVSKNQACLISSGMIFLLHNFLDFTLFLPEVFFIWWVIMGLGVEEKGINP